MEHARPSRAEIVGVVSSVLLVVSLLFLDWYALADNATREMGQGFICGQDKWECTGFETFPVLRWLLLAAASAPLILIYIDIRGKKLSWAPGEMTMVVGFTAFLLIFYNGVLDPPGNQLAEIGVSKQFGYYLALLATLGIAASGVGRAMEEQQGKVRKTPGTV